MFLRLGKITLADSGTDGVTRTLSAPAPELSFSPESIGVCGAKWTRQIARSGATYSLEITVGRRFAGYALAERFAHKHAATLNGLAAGTLRFETMLGDIFVYENAALSRVSVGRDSGVWVEMTYSFVCGAPVSTFAMTVGGKLVSLGGETITVNE